jgi:hypothetical protein
VVLLEGVVGSVQIEQESFSPNRSHPQHPAGLSTPSLRFLLREGALQGLADMRRHFQVALLSEHSPLLTERILKTLRSQKESFEVDGVYCKLPGQDAGAKLGQIYADFEVVGRSR